MFAVEARPDINAKRLEVPLQKWGRGSATPYAEHRSNMNVINISAKKSEP